MPDGDIARMSAEQVQAAAMLDIERQRSEKRLGWIDGRIANQEERVSNVQQYPSTGFFRFCLRDNSPDLILTRK